MGVELDELALLVQAEQAAVDVAVVRWEGLVGVQEGYAPHQGGSRRVLALTSLNLGHFFCLEVHI